MELEDFVKQCGFENEEQFHSMVSNVDLSTQEKMVAFTDWQENDGTKEGLEKLPVLNGDK
jgi:hypothetical protein